MTSARTLTWIALSDDFEPGYVDAARDKLTPLYEAAAARHGFRFRFVEAAELVPVCTDRPRLCWRGGDLLAERQCVIVSLSSWNGQAGAYVEAIYRTVAASDSILLNQAFESGGNAEAIERDKLAILHHAAGLGIPTPPTVMVPFGRYARLALPTVRRELGPGPYLLKPRDMGMGFGVLKVDTAEQLTAAIDLCAGADQAFLVQRFLPNSGDLRTYVINGRVVSAQLRQPAPGNYLANISQGGIGSVGEYDQVADYCAKIVSSTGASYLSVDWLMTQDGPVLNEWGTAVTSFAGLPEPERSQVADAFFAWAARRLGP